MDLRTVSLSREVRGRLLDEALALARPGDIILFNHRTSRRSRFIRFMTGCRMPHVCIYAGEGRVLGMLKKRVRYHPLERFFRDEYDIVILAGDPAYEVAMQRWIGREEVTLDLWVMGVFVAFERLSGTIRARARYHLRGVTCSGTVCDAIFSVHGARPELPAMVHTPMDLERILDAEPRPCRLAVRLIPHVEAMPIDRPLRHA